MHQLPYDDSRVEEVAKELGVAITLEKVEVIQDIMAYGILATPGVVVDGKVVHSGGVPTRDKIAGSFTSNAEPAAAASPGAAAADDPRLRASTERCTRSNCVCH